MRACAALSFAALLAAGAEHRGVVAYRGVPVPGAAVTAVRDGEAFTAVTDPEGFYSFADLTDGTWTVTVEMFGFAPQQRDIPVLPAAPPASWELAMLPLEQMRAALRPAAGVRAARPARGREEPPLADGLVERAADGFLIDGSVHNAAASPFGQAAAFGNRRPGGRRLYNGGIALVFGDSALDARPFSLTGQNTPKAPYRRVTGAVSFGGPLQIPRLLRNGPNFFFGYQWTRNTNATTASALMPNAAERDGVFARPVTDPATGEPFAGNVIPRSRISPQARVLLDLYPFPNFNGAGYNYQLPLLSPSHQDSLQLRMMKTLDPGNQVYGQVNLQSTRTDSTNLFGFLDRTALSGLNAGINWSRRLNQEWFLNLGYRFSRQAARVTPYFAGRANVSGQAGISGNNQDPANWGPPALTFASGVATLSDAQSSFNRSQTSGVSYSMQWNRGAHAVTFGGDFSRQQFNYLSQQDPRGTFTFTGHATGSDFADFLLGIPAASSLASGNADKYFRQSVYDAYIADDWRINHAFTLNAGVRWEYGAPITELYGRLVNLDLAPGFTASAPVVANSPAGGVTGRDYPRSLVEPYKHGFAPRAGIAWRPLSASSLVIRGGYGMYFDTSIYQAIALRMAQQPPLSRTLSIQNSAAAPLTLANGFAAPASRAGNTFAVDPKFRPGYAQNWQLSVQRDLAFSLQMTVTYLGIKGTHAMQALLPNTYPAGAPNVCAACPAGFAYVVSGGDSSRHSAAVQLRRRLRGGFTAALQYTFSKSIDDAAALGGSPNAQGGRRPSGGADREPATGLAGIAIAQNWLDLRGERGLSSFDQRHLLNVQVQYSTGMGLAGGSLFSGWKGALSRDWTFAAQVTAGSGLPQTPVHLAPVQGTGFTGTIRPQYTGAPLYAAPAGRFLNPAAYTAPLPGQWGNAGRNSITGPAQFALNASLGRTFRLGDRLNLDLRADATNPLNHVTFTNWNTAANSVQFGLPAASQAMRSVQTTGRLRF